MSDLAVFISEEGAKRFVPMVKETMKADECKVRPFIVRGEMKGYTVSFVKGVKSYTLNETQLERLI